MINYERGNLSFFSDLKGKAFNILPLSMMLAVGLSYGLHYVVVSPFCTQFVESFKHERMLNFVKLFPASSEIIM